LIKIDKTEVFNFDGALRGLRNPYNSWDKSDSAYELEAVPMPKFVIGPNDLKLCQQMLGGGAEESKFMRQIMVSVDITAPLYWWKEAQRYHWLDFVSSQSTMHCLLKFDVNTQCVKETNPEILKIVSKIKDEYNAISDEDVVKKKEKWRELVASTPCGFCLGATMTTNYQQLKTIYNQRKGHKLIEWHHFCEWCETLPNFLEITGCKKGE